MARLFALRGAITVEHNDGEEILAATERLVRALMQRNDLEPDAFVSCIFTCTEDLDAEFPAVAARRVGLDPDAAALRARAARPRLAPARDPDAGPLLR